MSAIVRKQRLRGAAVTLTEAALNILNYGFNIAFWHIRGQAPMAADHILSVVATALEGNFQESLEIVRAELWAFADGVKDSLDFQLLRNKIATAWSLLPTFIDDTRKQGYAEISDRLLKLYGKLEMLSELIIHHHKVQTSMPLSYSHAAFNWSR